MRNLWLTMAGLLVTIILFTLLLVCWLPQLYRPGEKPGEMPFLEANHTLVTVNTTRIGSDDPVETAVAVAQIVYPATEEENTPGAVILVNRSSLAEVLVATSRMQHFPVNAPILYVDENSVRQ